jgi:Predicted permease, DMT superfamily
MAIAAAIRKPTAMDLVTLVLTAFILATAFIAIKIALTETGPLWIAAIRVTLGFLVLLPYALWRGFDWPKSAGQWGLVFLMAQFNMTIPFFLISWSQQWLDAGVVALLMGTGPFLALIGSHFLTADDRMSRRKIVSVILGFIGILFVIGPSAAAGLGHASLAAQAGALAASASYVVAGLTIRHIDMPLGRLATLALAMGMATLLPLALLLGEAAPVDISTKGALALAYLGLFPSGIAYILRFHLIRTIGYTRFSMSANLVPVFGIVLGVVLLDEPLSLSIAIALAFVLAGLFIASGGRSAEPGATGDRAPSP